MTDLLGAYLIEALFPLLFLLLPILAVIRYRWIGAISAAIIIWLLGAISGVVHSASESEQGMQGVGFWLYFGWLLALAYAAVVYIVYCLVIDYRKNRVAKRTAEEHGISH